MLSAQTGTSLKVHFAGACQSTTCRVSQVRRYHRAEHSTGWTRGTSPRARGRNGVRWVYVGVGKRCSHSDENSSGIDDEDAETTWARRPTPACMEPPGNVLRIDNSACGPLARSTTQAWPVCVWSRQHGSGACPDVIRWRRGARQRSAQSWSVSKHICVVNRKVLQCAAGRGAR
jgi:hypothetical protein